MLSDPVSDYINIALMDLNCIFEIKIVENHRYFTLLIEYLNFFIRHLNVVVLLLVKFVISRVKLIENSLKFAGLLFVLNLRIFTSFFLLQY